MTYPQRKFDDASEWLFDRIWAEVKEEEFNIAPKKIIGLEKVIYKDIYRKWPSLSKTSTFMDLDDPLIANVIVSTSKEHLTTLSRKFRQQKRFFHMW